MTVPEEREGLLAELAHKGVKHTPEDVLKIGRTVGGQIVFLETGDSRAGLQHIVDRHAADFAGREITRDQIPDAVLHAVTSGKVVGEVSYGRNRRWVYEFEYVGKTQRIAVGVSSNGFIVTAHPAL